MNIKEILKHPLAVIVGFFFLLFAYSKFGPNLPISVITQQRGEPLVVTAEGKVTVVPDIAKVSLGIEESGASLKQAQNSVNKKSKILNEELAKLGIKEKEIKTTSYNVFPEQDYQAHPPRIVGYRVSVAYEVKVKDFEKINDVLVLATNTGVNVIGGLSFEVNEETRKEKLDQARKEAVGKAKEKAKDLARSAGVSLGRIITISSYDQFEPPFPPMALREAAIGGPAIEKPEIKPGETELTVQVTLSFEIR